MSTSPTGNDKSRNWNLGKAVKAPAPAPPPEKSEAEARPGRLAPPAPRPVTPVAAPPAEAEEPYVPPRERAIQQALAERPPLGRAVAEADLAPPKRSWLTHPATLVVVAIGFVCSLTYLWMSGSFGPPRIKTMPPPTPAERMAAFQAVLATQDLNVDAPPATLANDVAKGWVLTAAAQTLGEVANFVEKGPEVPLKDYQLMSVPGILKVLVLPPADTPEYFRARMDWDERALGALQVGEAIAGRARDTATRPADIRRVAQQLSLAGMARLDAGLKGNARSDFPGIDGAAERWRSERPSGVLDAPDAEVLRQLLPADFHRLVQEALSGS